MLRDLKERWDRETDGNSVFISATERKNIDGLRATILGKVKELYQLRYPYRTAFYS
jgi:GTP-binding protein HflX